MQCPAVRGSPRSQLTGDGVQVRGPEVPVLTGLSNDNDEILVTLAGREWAQARHLHPSSYAH